MIDCSWTANDSYSIFVNFKLILTKTRWKLWLKLTKDTPATHIGQRSRSYTGHECTQHVVLWWYTNVPNLVCLYMSRNKDDLANSWWKYNIDIEVKGQGHTEAMNYVIHSCAKYGMTMSKDKKLKRCGPNR